MSKPDRKPLSDPDDYILDLSSQAPAVTPPATNKKIVNPPAAYLSIHFKCCNVYSPIYKTADGAAYAGHCPKCALPVRIKVGPGGSTSRIFTAE
jgi:hypothetical protein